MMQAFSALAPKFDTSVALPQIPSSTVMPFYQDAEKRHTMKERDIKKNEKTFLFIYKTKCFVMEAKGLDLNPQICGPYTMLGFFFFFFFFFF
jgi:hypothetical protein